MREQYELVFQKRSIDGYGVLPFVFQKVEGGSNSALLFIGKLNRFEIESLIYDLDQSLIDGQNFDELFLSDSIEDITITIAYDYPNVIINNLLIISMQNLKRLLNEWNHYISL